MANTSIPKSWYKVYECSDTQDRWSFDSDKELFASDCMAKTHSFAYNAWLERGKTGLFTIIQPYDGSCRGGYGFPQDLE